MQIRFKPGLRTLWRGAGTVQIGLSPAYGTVLDGLTATDSRIVEGLRAGVDSTALDRASPARAARHRRLIDLLDDAGVLLVQPHSPQPRAEVADPGRLEPDAALWSIVHPQSGDGWPILNQRARQRVLICGAGRLGSTLATTLAAAGVGQICIADAGRLTDADLGGVAQRSDLGRSRQEVAAQAVLRAGGRAATADAGDTTDPGVVSPGATPGAQAAAQSADLVVLIEYAAADAAAADTLVASDVPHLSIVIREGDIMVGPRVLPGAGPCLRCLDLHRSDRDPAWPSILAQLVARPAEGPREESGLAVLGAGLAALQVLAHLDGLREPATAGATLEIEPPDGLVARRTWPAHPSCGCHWPPRVNAVPAVPARKRSTEDTEVVHDRVVDLGLIREAADAPHVTPGAPTGANGGRIST